MSDVLEGTHGFLFILAALLGTGFALAGTPLGLDLIRTVNEDRAHGAPQLVWLCATTLLVGFQAWFWARAIVEHQLGERSRWAREPWLVWTPRIFGALPFLSLLLALLNCGDPVGWPAWALVVLGLALLGFVIARQRLTEGVRRASQSLHAAGRHAAGRALDSMLGGLKTVVLVSGLVAAVLGLILFSLLPVGPAQALGPAAVVQLAVALIIPIMTVLIQLGRTFGVRTTEFLIVASAVFSLWVDNHAVRLSGGVAPRDDVPSAYAAWRSQASVAPDGSLPIVFVASAGGASRAAYWSGEVMSRLEELSGGQFSRHVFAISAVSGGGLGAVGFLGALRNHSSAGQLARDLDAFAGGDYLSPALAGGAFPDLLQRVLPIAFLPDRAEALERGWEEGWTAHCRLVPCTDAHLIERDFLSLWSDRRVWTPVLMIGGAREENGRRILTSSVDFGGYVDADDFHRLTGHDVRLSTAISNGARFPFVSPGGTLTAPGGASLGHIVDGGYFDGVGVETIRELASRLFATVPRSNDLKPIYLVLVNGDASVRPVKPANFGADLFGPLRGLYEARNAHGELLDKILREAPPQPAGYVAEVPPGPVPPDPCVQGAAPPPNVIIVCLCREGAPMDWALSLPARGLMTRLIGAPGRDPCGNYAKLAALAKRLKGGETPALSPQRT